MKTPLALAACALALVGGGLTAAEITGAFGDGAVDKHVVREPVRACASKTVPCGPLHAHSRQDLFQREGGRDAQQVRIG